MFINLSVYLMNVDNVTAPEIRSIFNNKIFIIVISLSSFILT